MFLCISPLYTPRVCKALYKAFDTDRYHRHLIAILTRSWEIICQPVVEQRGELKRETPLLYGDMDPCAVGRYMLNQSTAINLCLLSS